MKEQTAILGTQTVDEHRAVLASEKEPESSATGQIRIPVINRGHVSATVKSVDLTYTQRVNYGESFEINKTFIPKIGTEISPLQEYSVLANLPPLPTYRQGDGRSWSVAVGGTVKYEDGFQNQKSVYFCVSLNPHTNVWSRGCGYAAFVNFNENESGTKKHPAP